MTARIILVTGANRGWFFSLTLYPTAHQALVIAGIGLAMVQALATRAPDCTICLGCRSVSSGNEAIQELHHQGIQSSLECVELDVTDDSSIKEAVNSISQKYGKVDGGFSNFHSVLPVT